MFGFGLDSCGAQNRERDREKKNTKLAEISALAHGECSCALQNTAKRLHGLLLEALEIPFHMWILNYEIEYGYKSMKAMPILFGGGTFALDISGRRLTGQLPH